MASSQTCHLRMFALKCSHGKIFFKKLAKHAVQIYTFAKNIKKNGGGDTMLVFETMGANVRKLKKKVFQVSIN